MAGNIQIDAASNSGYQAASSSYSWSHTVGTGYNRILVVSIALLNVANDVATLTYNGVSLTRLRSDVDGTGTIRTDIYYLLNPASGTKTIAITLNQASVSASMASSYTGVSQYTPIDAQNGTTGTTGAGGGSASLATTVVTEGAWIVDAIATVDTAITVGAGQNQRSNVTGAVGSGGQSDKGPNAAGSITMQWDNVAALTSWTMSTFAMLPAVIQGTTTSTSSTSMSSTSISSTSTSISSTSSSISTSSTSTSVSSISTSSTSSSTSTSSTSSSISSTSSSTSSTSMSSTSSSTSISSTSSSISSTSMSSTSLSSTSSSSSISSTSTSFSSTSSSQSSTSRSTSSTSFSSTSSSSSTSSTTIPPLPVDYSYQDRIANTTNINRISTQDAFATSTTSSVSATYPSPATVGNLLIAAVSGTATGGHSTIPGWTEAVYRIDSGATSDITILYKVSVGGESVVSASNTGPPTSMTIIIHEYQGFIGTPKLDQTASSANTSTPISAGTTSTTLFPNELLFAAAQNISTSTVTSWSNSFTAAKDTNRATPNQTLATAQQLVSATGAYSTAVTLNAGVGRGSGGIATFYDTQGGAVDLINKFTTTQYSDVGGDDEDYFIEYGSEFMIRNYQYDWTNNTDIPSFTWRGRTTMDTRVSPILIQIFNVTSYSWETLAVANTVPPDTDFSVSVSQTTNVSNYYDSLNQVTFRSYQQII